MSATRHILDRLQPSESSALLALPDNHRIADIPARLLVVNDTEPLLDGIAGAAEDDAPIILNTADYARPDTLEEEFIWDWPRVFLSALTSGAVLLEPLLAYFLYDAIKGLSEAILNEFGVEDSLPWLMVIFNVISAFLVINNVVGTVSAMDLPEEIQRLLQKNPPIAENDRVTQAGRIFTYVNRGLALPSAAIFAASNAIAIAYLSENPIVRWLAGSAAISIEVITYHILSARTISDHSTQFVERLTNQTSTTLRALKSPLKTLEVVLESLALLGYKGISSGFIMHQLLKRVFNIEENNPYMLPAIATAVAFTLYGTTFSSVAPVHRKIFKERWNQLTPEEVAKGKAGAIGWIKDILLAGMRGAGVGWMMQRFIPGDAGLKFGLAIPTSSLLFLHKLYVLHRTRCRENAYRLHKKELIRSGRVQLTDEELNDRVKLFDKIAEHYRSPRFERLITAINAGSGAAKWIAFVGFLTTLQKTLDLNGMPLQLTSLDRAFLALAFGTATILATQAGSIPSREGVMSSLYTKFKIGPPTEKIAEACMPSRVLATMYSPKAAWQLQVMRKKELELEQIDRQAYQQLP